MPQAKVKPQIYTVRDAAEKILIEKGLEIDDAEAKEEFISDIEASINDRVDEAILEYLTEEQKKEFDKLIDSNPTPQEIREFIDGNISNMPQIIANAIINVRNIYLSQ